MSKDKKKTMATVGTVLRKIPSAEVLKQWVDHIVAQETWTKAGVTAEMMLAVFGNAQAKWQFFVGANPKDAKNRGFEFEDGFIAFATECSPYIEQTLLKNAVPLAGSGLIFMNYGKPNHKTVTKYMLASVERIISEKNKNVVVLSPHADSLTARVYKPASYEEKGTLQGVFGAADQFHILSKKLD